jgi:hypothetical protein
LPVSVVAPQIQQEIKYIATALRPIIVWFRWATAFDEGPSAPLKRVHDEREITWLWLASSGAWLCDGRELQHRQAEHIAIVSAY